MPARLGGRFLARPLLVFYRGASERPLSGPVSGWESGRAAGDKPDLRLGAAAGDGAERPPRRRAAKRRHHRTAIVFVRVGKWIRHEKSK